MSTLEWHLTQKPRLPPGRRFLLILLFILMGISLAVNLATFAWVVSDSLKSKDCGFSPYLGIEDLLRRLDTRDMARGR